MDLFVILAGKFFLFCFFVFFFGMEKEEGKDFAKKKDDMWIQYSSTEITLKSKVSVD